MKRFGLLSAAFGVMALFGSTAMAAGGRGSYHDELEHRAYHRELEHREAHRYPMSPRQHARLHDRLEHETYHDRLEHRAVHPHENHYRGPAYGGGHGHSGHGHGGYAAPSYVAAPSRGLGISTPRFSFWLSK